MNTNIDSYNKALGQESNSMGIMNALGNLAVSQINRARPSHTYSSLSHLARIARAIPIQTASDQTQTESEQVAQDMLPGVQKVGQSSQAWLDLYDAVTDRVEHQKILETKVKKKPW